MSYKTFITGRLTANKLTLNNINKTTFVIFHPCQKRRAYQPKLCMFDNEKNKYVRLEPKVCKIRMIMIMIRISLWNTTLILLLQKLVKMWYGTAITRRASFTQLFVVGSEANSLSSIVFVVKAINQDCSSVEGYKRNDNQPWYQGHPTIVFWEISVRSPLEWLKFSRAQEQLKISKMFRGDCLLGSEFRDLCGLFT